MAAAWEIWKDSSVFVLSHHGRNYLNTAINLDRSTHGNRHGELGPIEGKIRKTRSCPVPEAGRCTFSLFLSVARIDTPPLKPAALAFVSYGFVLARVRVR